MPYLVIFLQFTLLLFNTTISMKVLHILYQSLPQISGSSIRSRDILMSQKEIGLDSVAVTSPFQIGKEVEETINGIRYIRTSIRTSDSISDKPKPFLKRVNKVLSIIPFSRKLNKIIKREKPDILHAHAMFFCGLPAIYFGRKYKLPVVYEVRSLWMLKKTKKRKNFLDLYFENLLFQLELFVMKKADAVVALNNNLKAELLSKGISNEKVMVINNAVNTTWIKQLRNKYVEDDTERAITTFGYIGTLTPHEGIDFLIHAFKEFSSKYPNIQLKIYGQGVEETRIAELAKNIDNVYFLGAIQPDEVPLAFNSIDIIFNPRLKNKLTDSVTPLKPLEAMAYGKLFIGSDVGGIRELVVNRENGFLFKAGDKEALLSLMEKVLFIENEESKNVKKRAMKFVKEKKSWLANAESYLELYKGAQKIYE